MRAPPLSMSPPLPPSPYNSHAAPPLIFVTHLPSASSFYASILQPLGLQFLSSPPTPTPGNAVLNYGFVGTSNSGLKNVVVFSVAQSPYPGHVRPARITLSASCEAAVREFYSKSEVLNKAVRSRIEFLGAGQGTEGNEGIKAATKDFDGNMLEAVYRARDRGTYGGHGGGRLPAIETASTEREARRVLEWQEQVARSIGAEGSVVSGSGGGSEAGYSSTSRLQAPAMIRRAESYPVQGSERPLRLVRRETVTTEHYRRPEERDNASGRGISSKAVIGTLLGAAAGAAFAYAMVRSESPERTPAPRRASYENQGSHYTHVSRSPGQERVVERLPARSYVSGRDEAARPQYVEYVTETPRVHDVSVARIDDKSYVSQRPGRSSQTSRARSKSEVGSRYEKPLTILPPQSRARSPVSHASRRSSYKTAESRRERSPSRSRRTGSHVSSKSYHTVSTAKGSPPPTTSHVSTTTIRVVPSERERRVMHSGLEREVERRSSVVERARQVPLPVSVVSGRGYAASVAPSDSVSSVGTKRERERLRERMSIRDGAPRGW
jgi:hypothetical protein